MEDELIPKEETPVIEETIVPECKIDVEDDVIVPKSKIIPNVMKTPKKDKIIPYAVIRIIKPFDCDGNVIQGSVANYSPLQAFEVEKDRVYVGKPLMRWLPIENVELV